MIDYNKLRLLTPEIMEGVDKAITMGRESNCPIATVENESWTVDVPELIGLVNFALSLRRSYFQPVEFPPCTGIG